MQIEFLGSGGAAPIPRPGCDCPLCVEARRKGAPYSRGGPSLFVHGPDILIDTPEDSAMQINRAGLRTIAGCFYSHWHPDHTMGRRVWETRNADWPHWPPQHVCTPIYLPQQVASDFRTRLGLWDHFQFLQKFGVVRLVELQDGDTVTLNGVTIRPFRLAEPYVYAFLLEDGSVRVLLVPDELFGWEPPEFVRGVDLAVIPKGLFHAHPLTGAPIWPDDHPVWRSEASFEQTLAIVRQLNARRVIMAHIEEPDALNYDDYVQLETRLQAEGYPISFAFDTLRVEV